MMNRKIVFFIFVISTLLSSTVYAATYAEAEAAYNAGQRKQAVAIWQELADDGDLDSQLTLARMYQYGMGVKRDKVVSFKYYSQAAKQGSLEAQVKMGRFYMEGWGGVKQDRAKARELYHKAAQQGYAEAQFKYGTTYFNGEGVPTDYLQAYAWIHVAAEGGYEKAKVFSKQIAEVLTKQDLRKAKKMAAKISAGIKKSPAKK